MSMTITERVERLEEARAWSVENGVVRAYTNGEEIIFTNEEDDCRDNGQDLRDRGFWLVAIYEHGHLVGA